MEGRLTVRLCDMKCDMEKGCMWAQWFTMFGACSRLICMSNTRATATWIFWLCIGKISFGPSTRLWGAPVLFLRRGKDGALLRFEGSLAEMEVYTSVTSQGIGNIFAAIAVSSVYEWIMGNSLSIWDQMPIWRSGQYKKIVYLSIIHIMTVK